jgi:hypothetical protein
VARHSGTRNFDRRFNKSASRQEAGRVLNRGTSSGTALAKLLQSGKTLALNVPIGGTHTRAHFRAAVGCSAHRSSLCFDQKTVAWGADGEEAVARRWVICPMATSKNAS